MSWKAGEKWWCHTWIEQLLMEGRWTGLRCGSIKSIVSNNHFPKREKKTLTFRIWIFSWIFSYLVISAVSFFILCILVYLYFFRLGNILSPCPLWINYRPSKMCEINTVLCIHPASPKGNIFFSFHWSVIEKMPFPTNVSVYFALLSCLLSLNISLEKFHASCYLPLHQWIDFWLAKLGYILNLTGMGFNMDHFVTPFLEHSLLIILHIPIFGF